MKTIAVLLLLMASTLFADVNEVELVKDINEIPARVKALEQKTYSGTMTQILANRATDVNSVVTDINDIKSRTKMLAEQKDMEANKQARIDQILSKHTKEPLMHEKKLNVDFVRAVSDTNDIEINDPNYTALVEERLELTEWLLSINLPM
jgi:hypothetical protein